MKHAIALLTALLLAPLSGITTAGPSKSNIVIIFKMNAAIRDHAPSARLPAGTAENPQMLYPSDAAKPKVRKAKRAGKKQAE